ncbi:MAG: TerC family protein [Planctomycetes bacterium]|nr:TerC family protein [Planctomycetota bacterium]
MIWLFLVFVFVLLAIDLGVFHRKSHEVSVREALAWSAVWVALGLAFSVFVYFSYEHHWLGLNDIADPVDRRMNTGRTAALKYLTGYVVEKSLSVDNIFVMAMIFGAFAVPRIYQHRVLYWGILGALVMRGVMILAGTALITRFHWIIYIFGLFLIFTALKMLLMKGDETEPGENFVVRMARRFFRITSNYHGKHFMVRAGSPQSLQAPEPGEPVVPDEALEKAAAGTLMLTPLALALVMIEVTDVVFAVDSIPAIFAITADPFLVFTSNVFAILGLRSLYFVLSGMIVKFRYLTPSLALVLLVVGVKMLIAEQLRALVGEHINLYLLALIMTILGVGVGASIVHQKRADRHANR